MLHVRRFWLILVDLQSVKLIVYSLCKTVVKQHCLISKDKHILFACKGITFSLDPNKINLYFMLYNIFIKQKWDLCPTPLKLHWLFQNFHVINFLSL